VVSRASSTASVSVLLTVEMAPISLASSRRVRRPPDWMDG